jgi:hypothetical protein
VIDRGKRVEVIAIACSNPPEGYALAVSVSVVKGEDVLVNSYSLKSLSNDTKLD